MLDRRRHDVASSGFAPPSGESQSREVVALRGAAGEEDFVRRAGKCLRDPFARLTDRTVRVQSEHVRSAAGISEILGEEAEHQVGDARIDRGGRGAIEVGRARVAHCLCVKNQTLA